MAEVRDVRSSVDYYDMNRGMLPIHKITLTGKNVGCAAGTKVEKLYRWPGSVAGYQDGTSFHRGANEGKIGFPAREAFFANNWKGA